jgi:hypothetical protein
MTHHHLELALAESKRTVHRDDGEQPLIRVVLEAYSLRGVVWVQEIPERVDRLREKIEVRCKLLSGTGREESPLHARSASLNRRWLRLRIREMGRNGLTHEFRCGAAIE